MKAIYAIFFAKNWGHLQKLQRKKKNKSQELEKMWFDEDQILDWIGIDNKINK